MAPLKKKDHLLNYTNLSPLKKTRKRPLFEKAQKQSKKSLKLPQYPINLTALAQPRIVTSLYQKSERSERARKGNVGRGKRSLDMKSVDRKGDDRKSRIGAWKENVGHDVR